MKITAFTKLGKRRRISSEKSIRLEINEKIFFIKIVSKKLEISSLTTKNLNILSNSSTEILLK